MEEGKENEILKLLDKEGERTGLPSRFLDFYKELFTLQLRGENRIGTLNPGLKKEEIDERLRNGQPLIGYQDFVTDRTIVNDLFTGVIKLFIEYKDLFGEPPVNLTQPEPRRTMPKSLIRAWYSGTKLPPSIAADNADEHLLLEAITHAALKPYLVRYAQSIAGMVNHARWRRNYCPVCGGIPDFSYLEKEPGSKWLVCSRCDTSWLFQRVECPFCGNNEQKDLSYLSDEKGVYLLYTCEKCRKYMKTIDLRATDRTIMLPVERIITLAIDSQAVSAGYQPGNSP